MASTSTRNHTRSSSSSMSASPSRSRSHRSSSSSSGASSSTSSHPSQQPLQHHHSSAPPAPTPPPAPVNDGWYGHELTSLTAARFITSLFSCPNIPPASSPGAPRPSLPLFIAYGLHRTRLPPQVTTSALLLLSRLKARFPAARGSSGHRLFISAFMMASKVLCDDTYSNKSWCIVAQQMFTLKEINQMEREMLGYLEWNVVVSGEEIAGLDATLAAKFAPTPNTAPPTPITPSSHHPSTYAQIPSIVIAPSSAAMAYPSPPSSPIALSTSASSESSPTSSLGEPCTTPQDGVSVGYEASKKAFEGRHPDGVSVRTKVVERGNDEDGEDDEDAEMSAVGW